MSQDAQPGWYPQTDGSIRYWDGTSWSADSYAANSAPTKVPLPTKIAVALLIFGFLEPTIAGMALFLPFAQRGGDFTQWYFISVMLVALVSFIAAFVLALVGYRRTRDAVPRSIPPIAVLAITAVFLVPSLVGSIAIPLLVLTSRP